MEIYIQHHAIERYVEYYSPEIPDDEVHALLLEMLQRATHTKAKSSCGDFVWTCDGVRFVIKHDYGMRADRRKSRKKTYCVTVLPPEILDGSTSEYEEYLASV
jgi:hypothetical protein